VSERDKAVRDLQEMLRRINTAENDGNVAEMIGMPADDAVIMAPNQPVAESFGHFDEADYRREHAAAPLR
jgi:hypothetical protein